MIVVVNILDDKKNRRERVSDREDSELGLKEKYVWRVDGIIMDWRSIQR